MSEVQIKRALKDVWSTRNPDFSRQAAELVTSTRERYKQCRDPRTVTRIFEKSRHELAEVAEKVLWTHKGDMYHDFFRFERLLLAYMSKRNEEIRKHTEV